MSRSFSAVRVLAALGVAQVVAWGTSFYLLAVLATPVARDTGWPLARVEAVMRAVLRAGAYELRARKDVPPRVVIKEYVDVAGAFFGPTESGMVNAVLDKIAREERAAELA